MNAEDTFKTRVGQIRAWLQETEQRTYTVTAPNVMSDDDVWNSISSDIAYETRHELFPRQSDDELEETLLMLILPIFVWMTPPGGWPWSPRR